MGSDGVYPCLYCHPLIKEWWILTCLHKMTGNIFIFHCYICLNK
jgi:hypothetical protein